MCGLVTSIHEVSGLVKGLEERKSIEGGTAPDGCGDIIQDILSLVREQGREGVEGLSVADLLARAREEFADSEDETDDLRAETDKITDVVDDSRGKSSETSTEFGVNQVEK